MSELRPDNSVSIIFRSLNEEKWLGAALAACRGQAGEGPGAEIILVDSGSTDSTLDIARAAGARIVHIKKTEFTFGRSLNTGCEAARGDYLVFISAHCVPCNDRWLKSLIAPLDRGEADYVYGRQIGHEVTRFSEHQVFAQYFPDTDKVPQPDFFCNNANAALKRSVWARYRFDETVTGLEDMVLAKAIIRDGGRIGYVADAPVVHIHEESLTQIRRRYYREALTLREIMPEVHFNFGDFLRYFSAGMFHDFAEALDRRCFFAKAADIIAYRCMQYWGAYLGHNEHRVLSRAQKESYYYPRANRRARRGEPETDENAALLAKRRETSL